MESEFKAGNHSMMPSVITYNNAINAWAKSSISGKAARARMILDAMKVSDITQAKPNLYAFTSVMNAAAYTRGDKHENHEALGILWSTFNDIKESGLHPNHITYMTLIRGIKNLMEFNKDRTSILKSILQQCITNGHVNDKLLFAYKGAVSKEEFQNLGIEKASDIPVEWCKNC